MATDYLPPTSGKAPPKGRIELILDGRSSIQYDHHSRYYLRFLKYLHGTPTTYVTVEDEGRTSHHSFEFTPKQIRELIEFLTEAMEGAPE